jgi:MoxR-like ATPase
MTLAESPAGLASIDAVKAGLSSVGYVATHQIATAVYLAHHLRKPVLIEGPAGVGKTELAVSAARMLGFELLRLQCYEGLDDSKALYEWKYGKQLLYTQILKEKIGLLVDGADTLQAAFGKLASFQDLFFSRDFLQPRPLLQAMETGPRQRAADRRDRQERRVVRSAAAGGAGRLPGHHPRDRHHQGPGAAAGDPDVQQHARAG